MTCTVNGISKKAVEAKKPLSLTDGKTCNPTLKLWTKAGVQDWLETNDLKHLQTRYTATVTIWLSVSSQMTNRGYNQADCFCLRPTCRCLELPLPRLASVSWILSRPISTLCLLLWSCISLYFKVLNEWMNEWRNACMNEWMNECMNEWMHEWMNECMNEWMNAWMNEWTNEWRNERTNE